jgi:hypothetical protein
MLLTDDEMIALLARQNAAPVQPLPTIDLDQPEQVTTAAARGVRSLLVRGLADNDALTAELASVSSVVVGGDRLARTCVADRSGALSPRHAQSTVYVGDDGRCGLSVTSPIGVHAIEFMTREAALETVTQAVTDTVANGIAGPAGEDLDLRLVVASYATGGYRAIAVSRATVTALRRAEDDSAVVESGELTPGEGMSYVLGSAG